MTTPPDERALTFSCRTCDRVVSVPSPAHAPYRPFCSARCQMVDLGTWFNEGYRFETPRSTDTEQSDE